MLAHQGGWDEVLFVAVPMAFIAWVLWFTRQRVIRAAARTADQAAARTADQAAAGQSGQAPVGTEAPAEPPLSPPG